jgi:hypothetical protein
LKKRYSKHNKLPPFVALTWDLLNSPAYKALTPSSAKALPYFLGKVKVQYRDPERYEKLFNFSYPEAASYGFSSATFSRVRKELEKIGFIERVEQGGLKGKGTGYSKYRLSDKWESYGKAKPVQSKIAIFKNNKWEVQE